MMVPRVWLVSQGWLLSFLGLFIPTPGQVMASPNVPFSCITQFGCILLHSFPSISWVSSRPIFSEINFPKSFWDFVGHHPQYMAFQFNCYHTCTSPGPVSLCSLYSSSLFHILQTPVTCIVISILGGICVALWDSNYDLLPYRKICQYFISVNPTAVSNCVDNWYLRTRDNTDAVQLQAYVLFGVGIIVLVE